VKTHVDRWQGFAIDLPDGWQATPQQDGLLVAHAEGDFARAAFIWPIARREGETIDEIVKQVVRGVSRHFTGIEAWTPPPAGDKERELRQVVLRGNAPGNVPVRACVRVAGDARTAFATGFAVPEAEVAEKVPLLEYVLASFRLVEPLPREVFVEPNEGAFSLLYPKGWQARGRVQRSGGQGGPVTTPWSIEDPATRARVGDDGTSLAFFVPTGGPYTPADAFARGRLIAAAKQRRPDIELEKVVVDEDLQAARKKQLDGVAARVGARATVSTAIVWTHYAEGGVRFREVTVVQDWCLSSLANQWASTLGPSLRAPVAAFEDAAPVLVGIASSFRVNEAWDAREIDTIQRRMAQDRVEAARNIARIQQEGFEHVRSVYSQMQANRTATMSEIQRKWGDVINQKQNLVDSSGQAIKVDSGYDTYWQKGGEIVGSDSGKLDSKLDEAGWTKLQKTD